MNLSKCSQESPAKERGSGGVFRHLEQLIL